VCVHLGPGAKCTRTGLSRLRIAWSPLLHLAISNSSSCGFVGRGFMLGVHLGLFPDANPRRRKGRCTLPFRVRTEATAQLDQAM
jgi:hypothetical protein